MVGWGRLNRGRMGKRPWVEPWVSGLGGQEFRGTNKTPTVYSAEWRKESICSWPLWLLSLAIPNFCYQVTPDFFPSPSKRVKSILGWVREQLSHHWHQQTRAAFFTENPSCNTRLSGYQKKTSRAWLPRSRDLWNCSLSLESFGKIPSPRKKTVIVWFSNLYWETLSSII